LRLRKCTRRSFRASSWWRTIWPHRSAGCPLDQAEPYGDCLTYGPGHYETCDHWPHDRTVDPALRALVRSYEYEDWPRGRIVIDRARDLFVLYADRKLLTPARIQ
jgi:hypothetical protein